MDTPISNKEFWNEFEEFTRPLSAEEAYFCAFTHEGETIKSKTVDSFSAPRVGPFKRFDKIEDVAEHMKTLKYQEDIDLYTNFVRLVYFHKFGPVRNCNLHTFDKDLVRKVLLPYTFRAFPARPSTEAPAHEQEVQKTEFVIPEKRCIASLELESAAELDRIASNEAGEKEGLVTTMQESGGASSNIPCVSAFVVEEIGNAFICESHGISSLPSSTEKGAIEIFEGMKGTAMLEMYPLATRQKVESANVCNAFARQKTKLCGLDVLCPRITDAVVLCAGVGAKHMAKYLLKKNIRATFTAYTDTESILGPEFYMHSHLILNYPVTRKGYELLSERFALIMYHPQLEVCSSAVKVPEAEGWWMTDDYYQEYPLDLPFYNEGRYLADDVGDVFVFSPSGVDAVFLQTAQLMNIKLSFERGDHEYYRYWGHVPVDGKADVELVKLENVNAPPVEYACCPRTLTVRPYSSVITLSYVIRRGQFLELPGKVDVVRGKITTYPFAHKTLLSHPVGPVTVRYRYLQSTVQCVIVPG